MNELNTDGLRYLERPLHLSRASGRSAGPRYPSCPLIDQHVLQTAVLKQSAPRTLLISRFHVKPSPSRHISRASAQSGPRYALRTVNIRHRCGGGAITIQVKKSSHLLHGSAPNTDARRMRSGARQTSVLRVGTRAGLSRRTHRSGTSGTSPGGGPRIPFPHTRMNPGSIDVTPPAESERELSSATYGGFT